MSVEGNEGFLEIPNASLRVSGNVHAEGIKLGVVELIPSYDLASVSNVGNTTSNTVQFTNPTTSLVASSNIVMLNTANTAQNVELSVGENTNVYTRKTVLYPDMLGYTDADNDKFGHAVAISGDGKVIISSAYGDDDVAGGSGAVYVYVQNSLGEWQRVQKLKASDAAASDHFGGYPTYTFGARNSIDVSGDGSIIVVGANYEDISGSNSGSAYIFEKSGSTWVQVQKITGNDTAADDHFGQAVGVSGNGSTIAIAAPYDDDGGGAQGSVYMFEKVGGTWTQVQKLLQSDSLLNTYFGESGVRLTDDGTTLLVGAYAHDEPYTGAGVDTGAAYIFDKAPNGTWSQTQKLYGSTTDTGDLFGVNVDISGDGTVVCCGATHYDLPVSNQGAAFIFVKSAAGAWSQTETQIIQASDGLTGDVFGSGVSVSQNGDRIIVGAYFDDTIQGDSGSMYIFDRTNGVWTQTGHEYSGHAVATQPFGVSSGISNDGKVYIVGSPYDTPINYDSGSVFVYDEKIYTERMTHLSLRCPVMFEASSQGLTFNAGAGGGSVIVKWNYVHLNVGGGYDNKTGLFTAPIRGYYKFNANLMKSYATGSWLMWGWFKNGIRYHNANQPSAYDTTANNRLNIAGSIIVDLEVGDTFAVHTTFYYNNTDHGGNTISGFYLSA
jgi:hypothetical protein